MPRKIRKKRSRRRGKSQAPVVTATEPAVEGAGGEAGGGYERKDVSESTVAPSTLSQGTLSSPSPSEDEWEELVGPPVVRQLENLKPKIYSKEPASDRFSSNFPAGSKLYSTKKVETKKSKSNINDKSVGNKRGKSKDMLSSSDSSSTEIVDKVVDISYTDFNPLENTLVQAFKDTRTIKSSLNEALCDLFTDVVEDQGLVKASPPLATPEDLPSEGDPIAFENISSTPVDQAKTGPEEANDQSVAKSSKKIEPAVLANDFLPYDVRKLQDAESKLGEMSKAMKLCNAFTEQNKKCRAEPAQNITKEQITQSALKPVQPDAITSKAEARPAEPVTVALMDEFLRYDVTKLKDVERIYFERVAKVCFLLLTTQLLESSLL